MLRLLKWQARGQAAQNKEGLYQTDFHASSSAKWIRQNVPMSWRFLEKKRNRHLIDDKGRKYRSLKTTKPSGY
jgi:hypothetical protein